MHNDVVSVATGGGDIEEEEDKRQKKRGGVTGFNSCMICRL